MQPQCFLKPTSAGKWVFLAAVLINVLGTLFSPILAGVSHWWAVFHLGTGDATKTDEVSEKFPNGL